MEAPSTKTRQNRPKSLVRTEDHLEQETTPTAFDNWKECASDIKSFRSLPRSQLGDSIKLKQKEDCSMLSFKPMFEADWEVMSQHTMSDKMSDISMLSGQSSFS
mmetsp:Transcript_6421/g.10383  ORF Transcript_6421/g.10383 Transcript_6421/m.10383 type:complete len:104 (+) Transcript_6421:126-437(+)